MSEIEEKMQEKYFEMQFYDAEIKKVQKQIEKISSQIEDINYIKSTLMELKDVKPGTEILVPIANGIFAKAKIMDTNDLRVNVGNGINVNKTVEETDQMMDGHIDDAKEYRDQLYMKFQQMLMKAQDLEKEIKLITKDFEEQQKKVK